MRCYNDPLRALLFALLASASLWAPVPHYVAAPPNPVATRALLERFGSFTVHKWKEYGFRLIGFWTPVIGEIAMLALAIVLLTPVALAGPTGPYHGFVVQGETDTHFYDNSPDNPEQICPAIGVLYTATPKLFRALAQAQADGSLTKQLRKLERVDLLVVDDWGLVAPKPDQARLFLEVIDDRQGATLITSQYPVETWHELIGDLTVADAILDRVVHNAYRIALHGESMRGRRGLTHQAAPSGGPDRS